MLHCIILMLRISVLYLSRDSEFPFLNTMSDIRMEKAENLLKTSSDKVRKIALEVGYKDPNYFNRAFKKRHNMTPEEFRKRVG